ncbi:MAG: c-type cytochrome [Sulfurisoma sp.]|nr:c-type cytochrome [Sulfurisoma sp.]
MSMNSPAYRRFALASALIVAAPLALAMGNRPKADDEATNEATNARIQPVAKVDLAAAAPKAAAGSRTGEEIYKGVCGACHDAGVAGAPKTGDKGVWASRLGLGLDGLTKSAIKGKNAMPPKGGSDATDAELARAIAFMANKSGASFSAK